LATLQWLRGHGCPWSESDIYYLAAKKRFSHLALDDPKRIRYKELFQWVRDNGCVCDSRGRSDIEELGTTPEELETLE